MYWLVETLTSLDQCDRFSEATIEEWVAAAVAKVRLPSLLHQHLFEILNQRGAPTKGSLEQNRKHFHPSSAFWKSL